MNPRLAIPESILASTTDQRNRFPEAYSVLKSAIADRAFPGAAFGVLDQGRIIALDGVGQFTYDAISPAVAAATPYDLASVSKVLATTAAAMRLYDRGRFELDQPLGDILPAFVIGKPEPRKRIAVTLRTLLAHTSGLPAYARLFETHRTPAALLSACLDMPLEAAPGTRAEYSDIGFILLGKALEVLCGEPLDSYCAREVFAPLGLRGTCFNPPEGWRVSIPPTENDVAFRGRVIQGEVQDENCHVLGGVAGHAGVFSTVLDLLTFARCILNMGTAADGKRLFNADTVSLFSSRESSPESTSRALGWDTPSSESSSGRFFSSNSVGHLGYAGTSLWIDFDRQIAVTLLTNRTWPDRKAQAIRQVRPAFHDALMASLLNVRAA